MKFCDKLTKLRKNNNLSQEQLAEQIGVSRQAVSKWESGSSYPDMDKMLQLCKILDCKLDELMDDGVIGHVDKPDNKAKNYLNRFLDSITKIYNMFCSMTAKEKIKCLLELLFIFLIIWILGAVIDLIINYITSQLLNLIPFEIGNYFSRILSIIYLTVLIVIGFTIIYHLFKVRYLDYFILDDKSVTIIPKENNVEFVSKPKEKIIIRDPKDTTSSFTKFIQKIIKMFFKAFLIICLLPIICIVIAMLFVVSVSLYHINYGLLFISSTLLFLSLSLIGYIFIEMIIKFLFNVKQSLKRLFIMFITGILVIGISGGMLAMSLMNYKFINNNKDLQTETKIKSLKVTDNTALYLVWGNNDIEYIIDNSLEDVKIDITYLKGFDYELKHYSNIYYENNQKREYDNFYLELSSTSMADIYNLVLTDLKNKQFRTYNSDNFMKAKIYLSQKNFDILKKNHSCIGECYGDDDLYIE